MNESDLYKELGALTKNKDNWEESITYVASLLSSESTKVSAKALWLLGEMGLAFPNAIEEHVPVIAAFCSSPEPLLRERAVNALGRIGRGNYQLIEPYWENLFCFASDEDAKVRLSFIWASENIATNTPDVYENYMAVFETLLHDENEKVRMEAPEIFRVLGKRRPELVRPYLEQLQRISETDDNRVVRIHCLGAIKATVSELDNGGNGIMTTIEPLQAEDREQFIKDNQEAFNYGALQEFGVRDNHFEEDGQIISRDTIERSIDSGEAYRIIKDGQKVGGAVIKVDGGHGELELLFVSSKAHSKGIGYDAWCEIEKIHPEVKVWETVTPYFEKRNIHFYVNRCGFHIVEFYNDHHPDPNDPCEEQDTDEQFSDGMFRFQKKLR